MLYLWMMLIDDVINFKIYLQSSSNAMANRQKKRGGEKYKNLNILKTKKHFLDEITFFIVFEGLSYGEKIKIADTSFKYINA